MQRICRLICKIFRICKQICKKICTKYDIKYATNMQNMQKNMQNMSDHKTFQVYPKICKICNKYAKYVSQNLICRICTPHFADAHSGSGCWHPAVTVALALAGHHWQAWVVTSAWYSAAIRIARPQCDSTSSGLGSAWLGARASLSGSLQSGPDGGLGTQIVQWYY